MSGIYPKEPDMVDVTQPDSATSGTDDCEKGSVDYLHLQNAIVRSYSWEQVTVEVKDRTTKQPLKLLNDVSGHINAGELLAIMGPSGCGKTTLLNILANRAATSGAKMSKKLYVNGVEPQLDVFRKLSVYVEQEDALLGALTVHETINFAARLSLPSHVGKKERLAKVDALIRSFGLTEQRNTLVGTPVQKGISGGQKRRTSIASSLVTSPKILFLDEPTSGLDALASFEIMNFARSLAKKYGLLVVASIHQPSTSTFELFDKLLLLSRGTTIYSGPVQQVHSYFASVGLPIPHHYNPAEYLLELVNIDFAKDKGQAAGRLAQLQQAWVDSSQSSQEGQPSSTATNANDENSPESSSATGPRMPSLLLTLIHRNLIKSYRDIIAYTIRLAMYVCLGILMGTVWLRLSPDQKNIQPIINAIFFGGAFMSFMAVAYIPAFIEDLHAFRKERLNGLYGPTSFVLANFVTGAPYLFLMALLFSVISYWLGGFYADGTAFMRWVLYLYLDLLAAEGLVVLVSSIAPIFVVALAVTAFANGLWMCVNGFMLQVGTLNVFYRYVFHYVDYQAYVFQLMMVNEFQSRTYRCGRLEGGESYCMYPPLVQGGSEMSGREVLKQFGYPTGREGKWIGFLVLIILGYRVLALVVLWLKKH